MSFWTTIPHRCKPKDFFPMGNTVHIAKDSDPRPETCYQCGEKITWQKNKTVSSQFEIGGSDGICDSEKPVGFTGTITRKEEAPFPEGEMPYVRFTNGSEITFEDSEEEACPIGISKPVRFIQTD